MCVSTNWFNYILLTKNIIALDSDSNGTKLQRFRVTVGLAWYKCKDASLLKGRIHRTEAWTLQPFTCNGEAPIWVKFEYFGQYLVLVQSGRAFASNAEGWAFESHSRQTWVVKKRLWQLHCQTLGKRCECHGFTKLTIIHVLTDAPCHIRCGKLKNPHCSMAMTAE